MRKLVRHGAVLGLALVFASPAFAHWGPMSKWVTAGVAKYCEHDHDGFDYRKARVRVLAFSQQYCAEWGCWTVDWQDAEVRNDTNSPWKADIFLIADEASAPAGTIPRYLTTFQDVAPASTKKLSSRFSNLVPRLKAACHVSNNM